MYNRYIRNDNGVYTRVSQPETPPRRSEQSAPPPPPPPAEEHAPPPPPQDAPGKGEGKFLERILEKLHLSDVNAADLMLLALLFFLFEEKADDELLIGLGLLLIL